MSKYQINIAIAEACGWTFINQVDKHPHGLPPDGKKDRYTSPLPDYRNDLNAMHEAERVLVRNDSLHSVGSWLLYLHYLSIVTGEQHPIDAPAAQRAEAFLRTLGKWEDE